MKLNKTVYHKLLLQAREAQEQGLNKLATGVLEAIGPHPEEDVKEYSYATLQQDLYNDFWKSAAKVVAYYDLDSVKAEKLNEIITACAEHFTSELEHTLEVEDVVKGPFEPQIPGEDK